MKRFSSIAILLFYISISIGVHVDVDTCCKSIAGLSVFNEEGSHESTIETDCCAMEVTKHCDPQDHPENKGCPSDCVFIQVLQQAQVSSAPAALTLSPLELEVPFILDFNAEHLVPAEKEWNEEPPSLALSDKLFLLHSASITYG